MIRANEIQRQLEDRAGIYAAVEVDESAVVLSGLIRSDDERQTATDIVTELAPDLDIVDNLEVVSAVPEDLDKPEGLLETSRPDTFRATDEEIEAGDFTDQDILRNPEGGAGPSGVAVDAEISEGEEVYVPPTDPVRTRDNEFLGGFATSSTDDVSAEPSALDGVPGDEAIREAIERELAEDATTADFEIVVTVYRGIARLRGSVPSIVDAENAEEVAARVNGVVEVHDDLEVENV